MSETNLSKTQRNLTGLVEFSKNINSRLDQKFTINNLLLSCFGKFHTTKGFVALFENETLRLIETKGMPASFRDAFPPLPQSPECEITLKSFCNNFSISIIESINSSQNILGFIGLGEKISKTPYLDDEIEFFRTTINIAATAIQNSLMINQLKSLNKDLDSRINRLSSLFELSKEFGQIQEEDRIAKTLMYSLLGNFLTSLYAVIYSNDEEYKIISSLSSKSSLQSIFSRFSFKSFLVPLFKNDIIEHISELSEFQFEVLIPIIHQDETKGVLLLGKKGNKEDYSKDDIEFITSLVSIAFISLENIRLFHEALEKQKMEEELEIAREIQKNLLPKKSPNIEQFEIKAVSISSKQIGGDYHDLIKIHDSKHALAIGDVSGKGVPAALLMANLQAFLKSICIQGLPIEKATETLNNLLTENTSDGRFITFFWYYLDTQNSTIQYVNAGHNPPLLIRNGLIRYLDKGGMLLGVFKSYDSYVSEEITLEKDDIIVMFTDGITEAKNANDDEYTDERLEQLVKAHAHLSADELAECILNDVHEFVKGYPQSDDLTLLVMKYV